MNGGPLATSLDMTALRAGSFSAERTAVQGSVSTDPSAPPTPPDPPFWVPPVAGCSWDGPSLKHAAAQSRQEVRLRKKRAIVFRVVILRPNCVGLLHRARANLLRPCEPHPDLDPVRLSARTDWGFR